MSLPCPSYGIFKRYQGLNIIYWAKIIELYQIYREQFAFHSPGVKGLRHIECCTALHHITSSHQFPIASTRFPIVSIQLPTQFSLIVIFFGLALHFLSLIQSTYTHLFFRAYYTLHQSFQSFFSTLYINFISLLSLYISTVLFTSTLLSVVC